jgi:hypothetical protein
MKVAEYSLSERKISMVESLVIIVTALIPLFLTPPYRINLFLAWEGAFRMSNGEIPYRDFGSPVGYGFWILPALFFKIFGPFVYTLLVVQAFINIVSGFVFRALLRRFSLPAGVTFLTLIVYCLSYSMFNFWPWYNHLVFVFEIIGFYFLCKELLKPVEIRKIWSLALGAFFIALSFMTKQDTGALAAGIAFVLLIYDVVIEKNFKTTIVFLLSYVASMAILIVPFLPYEFTYWFNMGQFPHNARVDKFDIVNEFLGASNLIKFYLFFIVAIIFLRLSELGNSIVKDKPFFLFALLVLAILGQASIIQVTSYTPIDGNIYYHSFGFAFLLLFLSRYLNFNKVLHLATFTVLVCLWWSGVFWTRFLKEKVESVLVKDKTARENVISKRTYLLTEDTLKSNRSKWIIPSVKSFKRVRIPENTDEGIKKLMALPESKKPGVRILNMSELTPLAYDMGYQLETGASYPLWYHKGVAFFDREVKVFCDKVNRKEYDIILFEDIPNVNQFYPYEVRDCIKSNYTFKFKFLAPRIPEISYIEVYTKE